MPQLTVGSAIDKATALLEAAGVPSQEAATTARCIVASDRWGIGSHGLMRLPFYLSRLNAGGINPKDHHHHQKQLQIYQVSLSLMVMMVLVIGSYKKLPKLHQNARW